MIILDNKRDALIMLPELESIFLTFAIAFCHISIKLPDLCYCSIVIFPIRVAYDVFITHDL